MTLSTAEAEFVAVTSYACQAIWMRNILGKLNFSQKDATPFYCDNNSAIKLSKNLVLHGKNN